MLSTIQLRRATLSDLSLVQQIGADSYRPYYQHVWRPGGVEWYIEYCFGTEHLIADLGNPEIEYYLPTNEQGEIIGLLKLQSLAPIPDGACENALFLEKLYLLPAFFGQGFGQKLIKMVIDQAQKQGREAVWLQVMHNPGPIGAYAKAGFRITGPTQFAYDLLLEEERDGWIMVLNID